MVHRVSEKSVDHFLVSPNYPSFFIISLSLSLSPSLYPIPFASDVLCKTNTDYRIPRFSPSNNPTESVQCDQNGQFLKVLGNKVPFKCSPNI